MLSTSQQLRRENRILKRKVKKSTKKLDEILGKLQGVWLDPVVLGGFWVMSNDTFGELDEVIHELAELSGYELEEL